MLTLRPGSKKASSWCHQMPRDKEVGYFSKCVKGALDTELEGKRNGFYSHLSWVVHSFILLRPWSFLGQKSYMLL